MRIEGRLTDFYMVKWSLMYASNILNLAKPWPTAKMPFPPLKENIYNYKKRPENPKEDVSCTEQNREGSSALLGGHCCSDTLCWELNPQTPLATLLALQRQRTRLDNNLFMPDTPVLCRPRHQSVDNPNSSEEIGSAAVAIVLTDALLLA